MSQEQEYVSGLGKDSVVPPEIKGWNWGAFLLNWIWGIGNSTYIALLMFVPLVNIFMFLFLVLKEMNGHGGIELGEILNTLNKRKRNGAMRV